MVTFVKNVPFSAHIFGTASFQRVKEFKNFFAITEVLIIIGKVDMLKGHFHPPMKT